MHRKEFKKSLEEGKHVFGTNLPVQSADLIERIGYIGYDWVMIDDEHVFNNDETMANMIRAAEIANVTPLIRLRDPSPSWCYQFLDMGVGGIILSHTESPQEVLDLIELNPDEIRSLVIPVYDNVMFGKADRIFSPKFLRSLNQ